MGVMGEGVVVEGGGGGGGGERQRELRLTNFVTNSCNQYIKHYTLLLNCHLLCRKSSLNFSLSALLKLLYTTASS